jgi:hypothetical protein
MAKAVPVASDVTLLDASSLFHAGEALAEISNEKQRLAPRYDALRRCLDRARAERGWPNANVHLALVGIDRANQQQQRFVEAVRHAGFDVDTVDFRETFPSNPPSLTRREAEGRVTPCFSTRIAYISGLLARHIEASLLVVGHGFELYAPLLDLSFRLNGRVGLAYFKTLLEYRWQRVDAISNPNGETSLTFVDLDPYCKDIFGIDLDIRSGNSREVQAGLNRF